MLMNIPIAHIHGGELTLGLIDDAIRHSITKMSHLHFVTTKSYKKRIIQLGENKKNIFHVGAPGIENIYKLKLMKKQDIEESLGTKFNKKFTNNISPGNTSESFIGYLFQKFIIVVR